jgi:hypothetical protein
VGGESGVVAGSGVGMMLAGVVRVVRYELGPGKNEE